MPVRDTSKDAFIGINEDGTARTQRGKIYLFLKKYKSITRTELADYTGIKINAVCGRVRELIDEGYVIEDGKKKCSRTGQVVYALTTKGARHDS